MSNDDDNAVFAVEWEEVGVPYGAEVQDRFVFSTREAAEEWLEREYGEAIIGEYFVAKYPVRDAPPESSDNR